MTVYVESLIRSLGKSYKNLIDSEIITYKSEPKGASGDPDLALDMVKEGIYLSFKREGRILQEITLRIRRDNMDSWFFPNELPTPLQKSMSRQWVHETFGEPDKAVPPKIVAQVTFGWTERFAVEDFHIPITMQISYDMKDMVKKITFLATSELRW